MWPKGRINIKVYKHCLNQYFNVPKVSKLENYTCTWTFNS